MFATVVIVTAVLVTMARSFGFNQRHDTQPVTKDEFGTFPGRYCQQSTCKYQGDVKNQIRLRVAATMTLAVAKAQFR